jgi:hypothetical protein
MDIRQFESTSVEDDVGEFHDRARGEENPDKRAPQDTCLLLRQDLGLQVPAGTRLKSLAQTTILGITYSKQSKHSGNANVLVKQTGSEFPRPAKIVEILQVQGEIVMLVQYHLEPPEQAHNPFSAYPAFQTSMWGVNLSQLSAIRSTQIDSHFAELSMSQKDFQVIFAISLSRVRVFLLSCSNSSLTDSCRSIDSLAVLHRTSVVSCHPRNSITVEPLLTHTGRESLFSTG